MCASAGSRLEGLISQIINNVGINFWWLRDTNFPDDDRFGSFAFAPGTRVDWEQCEALATRMSSCGAAIVNGFLRDTDRHGGTD